MGIGVFVGAPVILIDTKLQWDLKALICLSHALYVEGGKYHHPLCTH